MFYGWWIVAYTFLMAVWGWGLGFYGLSVFLVALQKQNAWSASTISFGIAVYYLLGALVMSSLGDVMRRLGARRAVLMGICAMAAGVVGLTWVSHLWQLYVAFAVMAFGWATMSSASINILLAPWFDRLRGIAVSLAMTGATCGGMVVAPVLLPTIGALGFRVGAGAAVAAMLAMLLPFAAVVLRRTPEGMDLGPDGGTVPSLSPRPALRTASPRTGRREALRTRRYWSLSIAFALGLAAQVGLLTHFVAFVAPLHGTAVAALTLSLATGSALVCRFVGGGLADRFDRRIVAAGVFVIQAVGVFLLTRAASPWALYAGCVLFGSGVGNVTTLPALIVHKEFRADQFAPVVSLVTATNQAALAFAPGVLGVLRDLTGSYQAPLVLCMALQGIAAAVVLVGRERSAAEANARSEGAMLQLRPNCECCDRDLAPDSPDAVICSFECTFCLACAETMLHGRCPNCGGELVRRPIRPPAALKKHPASTQRVTRREPCMPAA